MLLEAAVRNDWPVLIVSILLIVAAIYFIRKRKKAEIENVSTTATNHNKMDTERGISLIAGCLVFVGFFLPWANNNIVSISGYDFTKIAMPNSYLFCLLMIPIGGILMLIHAFYPHAGYHVGGIGSCLPLIGILIFAVIKEESENPFELLHIQVSVGFLFVFIGAILGIINIITSSKKAEPLK